MGSKAEHLGGIRVRDRIGDEVGVRVRVRVRFRLGLGFSKTMMPLTSASWPLVLALRLKQTDHKKPLLLHKHG